MPRLLVAIQFQALLTPISGFFSVFPLGTKFTIGLGLYLELQVNARDSRAQIRARYSGFSHTLNTNAYRAITLYRRTFQFSSARYSSVKSEAITPHLHSACAGDSVCSVPISIALLPESRI